jgi:hypothetical protein
MPNETTKIKICGLRSAEAALVAATAGANYLGFNFVEGVRRQLQPDEGTQIIAEYRARLSESNNANRPGIIGLFLNQDPDFVNEITRKTGLDYLQLCAILKDGSSQRRYNTRRSRSGHHPASRRRSRRSPRSLRQNNTRRLRTIFRLVHCPRHCKPQRRSTCRWTQTRERPECDNPIITMGCRRLEWCRN